jgi:hypothetical protein
VAITLRLAVLPVHPIRDEGCVVIATGWFTVTVTVAELEQEKPFDAVAV